MNQAWTTYGCTKCNKYSLLVIDVNIAKSDTRSGLESYNTKNGVQYPSVLYSGGGSQWDAALNNQSYGNPEYWVKPDKSIVRQPNIANEISKAGLKPHVCAVAAGLTDTRVAKAGILIGAAQSGMLHLRVGREGPYTITAFASDGKKIQEMYANLSAGDNRVPLLHVQGVLIVSVIHGSEKAVKRVSCAQ